MNDSAILAFFGGGAGWLAPVGWGGLGRGRAGAPLQPNPISVLARADRQDTVAFPSGWGHPQNRPQVPSDIGRVRRRDENTHPSPPEHPHPDCKRLFGPGGQTWASFWASSQSSYHILRLGVLLGLALSFGRGDFLKSDTSIVAARRSSKAPGVRAPLQTLGLRDFPLAFAPM